MSESSNQRTVCWQTLNASDWLREEWEDECFLFNPASGNTHVLNQFAVKILDRLDSQKLTVAELAETFADELAPGELSRIVSQLEQHLLQLDELGLITTIEP